MALRAAFTGFDHGQALTPEQFEAYFEHFRSLKDPIAQLHALRWIVLPNEGTTDEIAKRFIGAIRLKKKPEMTHSTTLCP